MMSYVSLRLYLGIIWALLERYLGAKWEGYMGLKSILIEVMQTLPQSFSGCSYYRHGYP